MFVLLLNLLLVNKVFLFESCFKSQCLCDYDSQVLDCTGFTNYKQLNFTSNTFTWSTIRIISANSLQLNNDLSLKGLKFSETISVQLSNINSFDTNFDGFQLLSGKLIELSIENSKWKISSSIGNILFANLNFKSFDFRQVEFIDSVNPLVFNNSNIKELSLLATSGNIKFSNNNSTVYVKILKLAIADGTTIVNVTQDSLLNYELFKSIKEIEIISTFVNYIDPNILLQFQNLSSLTLNNIKLKSLLETDSSWLRNLNLNKNQTFRLILGGEVSEIFTFEDDNLCLFEEFPHENNVIPLVKNPSLLPCSCTIYWLFKNYQNYSNILTISDKKLVPSHCLEINSIFLIEQLDFCQNFNSIDNCKGPIQKTTSSTTTTILNKECSEEKFGCKCDFNLINHLECSIDFPNEFSTTKWDHVLIKSSTIKPLKNLYLAKSATLIIKNALSFDDAILSEIKYEEKFRLVIENSSLNSLGFRAFSNVNLSQILLTECYIQQNIPITIFEGTSIDELIIDNPVKEGLLLQFSSNLFLQREARIRKFIIKSFKSTDPFGIDRFTLPFRIFSSLEELEIQDSIIDFIESITLTSINTLHTLRFQNINLTKVIQYDNVLGLSDGNFLSNSNLKNLFLGREYASNFTFQNEYFCYFNEAHSLLNVYIYDSIDFFDGPKCTCTILRLYQYYAFDKLEQDSFKDYVPKCIKRLGTEEAIRNELRNCLGGITSDEFCNPPSTTNSPITTPFLTTNSLVPLTTTSFKEVTSSPTSNNLSSVNTTVLVLVIVQFIFSLITLVGLAFAIWKIMNLQKQLNTINNQSVQMELQ